MPPRFASPDTAFPIRLPDGSAHPGTVFLSAVLQHARIEVGDYSYASAFDPPADPAGWAARLAPYLFDFSPERLVIGKFCQIADGATFITASAQHRHDGFSSFPFAIFDGGAAHARPSMPAPGQDTIIGNDVWIGQGARILPGARIGSGVIVGAGAVVGGAVPDYAVVIGNPGKVLRLRFDPETIARLLQLAWWTWPIDHILSHEAEICGADLPALESAAKLL
ncbi:CatB-related O-acetyltransferase [Sedimentitalea todarodis]|uniref:CatB-related O-acetyltransferase n=1 Tax=Sedimentitalea todarodis TaxID=1631240 RepID=A0ABU3VFS0_9RHOB|nr:CatB-related O-acetyltransferase [Sedimentitalea todarodis]MDU9005031.1 CatB-related O-acetyltransferase [Sedimentitalea todarodis]